MQQDIPGDRSDSQPAALEPPAGPADPVNSGFLPASPPRATAESIAVRLIATAGVIGIGTAIGAAMVSGGLTGWIVGLIVSAVSVILAALLWRSRTL
jgi:hypothetical protein